MTSKPISINSITPPNQPVEVETTFARRGKGVSTSIEQHGLSLGVSTAFILSTVADILLALAIFPIVLFSGPSATDTICGAALSFLIIIIAPLLSITGRSAAPWAVPTLSYGVRLLSALLLWSSIFYDALVGAGLYSLCLATICAARLFELGAAGKTFTLCAERNGTFQPSRAQKFLFAVAPVLTIVIVQVLNVETNLAALPAAATLYGLSFFLMLACSLLARARMESQAYRSTTGGAILTPVIIPDIFLSVPAAIFLIVPVLLVLTDQSSGANDQALLTILTGWFTGALVGAFFPTRTKPKIHLILIVLLIGLVSAKLHAVMQILLFLSSAAAASIVTTITSVARQAPIAHAAIRLSVLAGSTIGAFVFLSPTASVMPFSFVLKTLAISCLIPLAMSAVLSHETRMSALRLVAHMIPIRSFSRFSEFRKTTTPVYLDRGDHFFTAVLVGYRLNARIVLLTADNWLTSVVVKRLLALIDISAINHEHWNDLQSSFQQKLMPKKPIVVYDFSQDPGANHMPVLEGDA